MLIRFLVIFSIIVACKANLSPTEEYPHTVNLDADGKVVLYWKYDEVYMTFELHGNTTGWVGMGISPNGGMTGADITVGWVVEGDTTITDRHGTGNQLPPLDSEQNIEVLHGKESDGWTAIKFKRQLAACDPDDDLPITADTLKIIYAFGESEPSAGNDLDLAYYHHSNRGAKSLLLLENSGADETNYPDGETHKTFDLLNEEFEIPAETTYYNCRLHKIPEFTQKQHVVKVEPVVQPGNELFVHHILVYQCTDSINETESLGTNTRCYGSDMPPDFISCSFVIQAWAIGGMAMYYPSHAGFPLGEGDSPRYVVVETHYDNPEEKAGVVDSSGLRFTYTSQLRQYDAGILSTGHIVTGVQHIIPPNAESFLTHGECTANCLEQNMKLNDTKSLKAFAVGLHTHLLGTGLTLRHIRNTTELPYITKDNAYDFNYQETRTLPEEREILPGDSLQVICDYKTAGDRTEITTGGLSTEKEMCLAFVYYYPKMPLTNCETAPEYWSLLHRFGIDNAEFIGTDPSIYNDLNDFNITSPPFIAGLTIAEFLNLMTWNEETTKVLEDDLRDMLRIQSCKATQHIPGIDYPNSAPVIDIPYKKKELECLRTNSSSTTTTSSVTTTTKVMATSLGGEKETTTGGAAKIGLSFYCLIHAAIVVLIVG